VDEWWVMMNECDQETEQKSGYGDMQVERWRESCMWERESYIRYVHWLLLHKALRALHAFEWKPGFTLVGQLSLSRLHHKVPAVFSPHGPATDQLVLPSRVINLGFPKPGYPGNPAIFQTRKPGFWLCKKTGFFGFGIFTYKPKWILKTCYVRPYFCYVVTSGPTDPTKHR